jgi:hypothetical protein
MAKKVKSSKITEREYRVCWLETNLVTTTVKAKSPKDAVEQVYDFTENRTTLIYGQPLPESAWCVDSDDFGAVPESIVTLAESLNVDIKFFIEDELRRLKNPTTVLLALLTDKQNKITHYERELIALTEAINNLGGI